MSKVSTHIQFDALSTKLCWLEVWNSKWGGNLVLQGENEWSSKIPWCVEYPFTIQEGGRGVCPRPQKVMVSGDFTTTLRSHGTPVWVFRGIG